MGKVDTKNPLNPVNAALAADIAGVRDTSLKKNASVFRLRLIGGKVDEGQLKNLFEAARSSKTYQRNKENYQFTVVKSSSGNYLALKQQGLWSKFKSLFPSTQAARQERRALAADIILTALDRGELDRGRMTLARAKTFQRDLIDEEHDDGPITMSQLIPSGDRLSGQLLSAGNGNQHQSSEPISDEQVGSLKKSVYLKPDEKDPYDKPKVGKNSIELDSHQSRDLAEDGEDEDDEEALRASAKQRKDQKESEFFKGYILSLFSPRDE